MSSGNKSEAHVIEGDFIKWHAWYNVMVQDYAVGGYEFTDIITGSLKCSMGVPSVNKDTAIFRSGTARVDITFFGRTTNCETVCFEFFLNGLREDKDVITRFYDKDGNIETCHFR